MIIWLNGSLMEEGPVIGPADRGLLLGDGAFETIYVENGRCAFAPRHLRRLRRGLGVLRIPEPAALRKISKIISAIADANGVFGCAAARLTVTRGSGARGLKFQEADPTMLVSIAPLRPAAATPVRLFLSARRRFAGGSTAGFKAIGGYTENLLAHNDALEAGRDEGLMLNEKGRLASAAAANVFLLTARGLATPPVSEGALPGVVRSLILENAAGLQIAVEERPVEVRELAAARIFLTNSLIGLKPATFEGSASPARKQAFRALQSWYQDALKAEVAGEPR